MDVILYWNDVALEANRLSHAPGQDDRNNGPTQSSRALALVHLAMYDAYAGLKSNAGDLAFYNPDAAMVMLPPNIATWSPQAAAAGAAHKILSEIYQPSLGIDFNDKLANSPRSTDLDSRAYGVEIANLVIADRIADPDAGNGAYQYSDARGSHRQDPERPTMNSHAPNYGKRSKGFAITKRHELDKYPALNSAEFNKSLRQVRAKGIAPELAGTLPSDFSAKYRTPEESLIGIYWGYDGALGLGTPPRLYNQIVQEVAKAQNNTEDQNARLFALVNVAMADAGILAWEQKYRYNLMRPVVGIREGDKSLGATAIGNNNISSDSDPLWIPLGAPNTNKNREKNGTPPFPAYPSGHATFGAAAFQITRLFYDRNIGHNPDDLLKGKYFVSDEFNGKSTDNVGTVRPRHARNFPEGGLWQMIVENGLSRVYIGVHWSFDAFALKPDGSPDLDRNIGGVPLGLAIAKDIFNSGMKKSTVGPALVA